MNTPTTTAADRIEKRVEMKAPIDKVWRALTDHQQFGEWFLVKLEGPFTVGQVTKGYITYPGYEHLPFTCEVAAMESPRRFAFTWHPFAIEPDFDYSSEPQTLVEFTLEPTAGGTRLTVVESGFDRLPAHRRDIAFQSNDGGWAEQMENIRAYVER
jgi:uncharacterized protein YndB with AHSA1/START domain